jgi:hypothetical protein
MTDPIRPAATILLLRDQPAFEVLMVKRHHQIDFAAGALVFPGGKSHAGDHDPAWADHATGWNSVGEDGAPLRIAAIREPMRRPGCCWPATRRARPIPARRRSTCGRRWPGTGWPFSMSSAIWALSWTWRP